MPSDFGDQLTGRGRGIRDRRVLAAMDQVPREAFVPKEMRGHAYEDRPLPIGGGQTISQPFIVALMTEALGLAGGEKVLEVGTGSGYQAAVLAELGCEVFSVEFVEALSLRAGDALGELGYEKVHLRVGDGAEGWPEEAPFDRIIVTCAAEEMPGAWLDQLAVGGRMVVPVGGQGEVQELRLYRKDEGGEVSVETLTQVRFVPLV